MVLIQGGAYLTVVPIKDDGFFEGASVGFYVFVD